MPTTRTSRAPRAEAAAILSLALLGAGCVERLLEVRSDPPGADVFLNGKQIGTTPLDHRFAFYGTVDVVLRREGYRSRQIVTQLEPPWYSYFPLDFFAEYVNPWTLEDRHRIDADLEALPEEIDAGVDEELERRAAEARDEARSRLEEQSPPGPGERREDAGTEESEESEESEEPEERGEQERPAEKGE